MRNYPRFAEVIVDIQVSDVDRVFHYRIPEKLQPHICIGHRVLVPFGRRKGVEGYIVGFPERPEVTKLKDVRSLLDQDPVLTGEMVDTARWMSERFLCLFVQALQSFLPPGIRLRRKLRVRPRTQRGYRLAAPDSVILAQRDSMRSRAPKQAVVLDLLLQRSEAGVLGTQLLQDARTSYATLSALVKKGFIEAFDIRIDRDPLDSVTSRTTAPPPTPEQLSALSRMQQSLSRGGHGVYLLHGVTGSGKTEVYLQAVETVIARGLQAIVMVPEISLTPQVVNAFRSRFGQRVAVLHSRLGLGERYDQWEKARRADVDIVVGARSAVFAPLERIGVVIIDEEHEFTYKQEETPKYHARDVAVYRAQKHDAPVLLGSATPAMESYHRTQTGSYTLIRMRERVAHRPLPPVQVIDMRSEMRNGNRKMLSRTLHSALQVRLQQGEQSILFLNRRGFATFVLCRECGAVMRCPSCDVSLTLHRDGTLRCHYCGGERPLPSRCPDCHGEYLRPFGAGTQRLEAYIREVFPDARVLRMDADTTGRKGAHARMLRAFRTGEYDVLLGTQMIAKGLDFPRVTLVGVVAADTSLNFPDFRAAERTFQLLTQVAGRTGRGDAPGEVIVQTYAPDHYSIENAARHDYDDFFAAELEFRRRAGYPPFSSLVRMVFWSAEEREVIDFAQRFAGRLAQHCQQGYDGSLMILGPAPAPLSQLKGRFRWHLFLKGPSATARDALRSFLAEIGPPVPSCGFTIDVDPVNLL